MNCTHEVPMHRFLMTLVVLVGMFISLPAYAETPDSGDVDATITSVDQKALTITLSDGKVYSVPEEFDFEGLSKGVKVSVFYTLVDGKRMVNDLQVEGEE